MPSPDAFPESEDSSADDHSPEERSSEGSTREPADSGTDDLVSSEGAASDASVSDDDDPTITDDDFAEMEELIARLQKETGQTISPVTVLFEPQPVPEELYSDYDRAPFQKCVVCNSGLDDRIFQIQKTYRGREVVFEMAVCEHCGRSTCEDFSQESLAVMQGFVGSLVDAVLDQESGCGSCGRDRETIRNYSVVGLCRGETMVMPTLIVCEECEDNVQSRLSKSTRERQGDFIRDNFPGVPADLDLAPLRF